MARTKIILANDTRRNGRNRHWGCWLTVTNLEALLNDGGFDVVDRLRLGAPGTADPVWERIEKGDLLVINGEGSVHSGTYMAENVLSYFSEAKQRGIPAWIVNHGCLGCDNLLQHYDAADFIAVRDIASMGYLVQHGISPCLAADCCFLSLAAVAEQRNQLLVCSGLKPPPDNLIAKWAEGLNCSEVVLCNDFYATFESRQAVKSSSAEESFKLFASSKFVISSSYHGCVFASINQIPFLPVRVPGQPPKALIAAVEAMGRHASRIRNRGPGYVLRNYAEIVSVMRTRAACLRERARFNLPESHR